MVVSLFLKGWYLSGQFCLQWFLFKSGVQSTWVIKLNRNKTGFLIVLLPFGFIFCIDEFYEVALSEWNNGVKKPEGAVCNFPRAKVCGGSSCPCALGRLLLRAGDSSHQGGLSSPQGQAWGSCRRPNREEMSSCPASHTCRKGEEFFTSFSSLALACQGNIIRLCLVLKYKLGRCQKWEISLWFEWKLC